MTNNNTHKENDMFHDDFDTQIQCDELFNEAECLAGYDWIMDQREIETVYETDENTFQNFLENAR